MALRLSSCVYGTLSRHSRVAVRVDRRRVVPSSLCVKYNDYKPYTTNTNDGQSNNKPKSNIDKIRMILKEYGTVGVVFHTCISLTSLGTCYVLVSK